MILTKEVNNNSFYKTYYTAINGILNLTNKQLEVLAEFSYIKDSLPDTFTEDQKDEYTFSSSTRGIICEKLGITIYNLNNIIKELKNKGFLVKNKKVYKINPFLFTSIKDKKEVEFKFLFKIN